jgi:hypothetical protein
VLSAIVPPPSSGINFSVRAKNHRKNYLMFHEKARAQMSDTTDSFHKSLQTYMRNQEYLEIFEIYLDIRVRDFKNTLEV